MQELSTFCPVLTHFLLTYAIEIYRNQLSKTVLVLRVVFSTGLTVHSHALIPPGNKKRQERSKLTKECHLGIVSSKAIVDTTARKV